MCASSSDRLGVRALHGYTGQSSGHGGGDGT
jgi:hypothetical protein